MKEGALTPQVIRVPSISLDESIRLEMAAMKMVAEIPGVKSVVSPLGRGESPADPAGPNESTPVALIDPDSGRDQEEIEEDIRKKLSAIPGVQVVISQPIAQRVDEMLTGVRSQLGIKVFGDDLNELRQLSEQVAKVVRSVRGARDIRVERLSGQQFLTVDIDRNAIARYGLNVADVQTLIETAIGGKEVTTLFEGERRYGIQVRFPQRFRESIEDISNMLLRTSNGAQVPLSSVAKIQLVDGPAQVSREWGKRRVVVGANVEGRDLGGFVEEVQQRLAKEVKLPQGYYFSSAASLKISSGRWIPCR